MLYWNFFFLIRKYSDGLVNVFIEINNIHTDVCKLKKPIKNNITVRENVKYSLWYYSCTVTFQNDLFNWISFEAKNTMKHYGFINIGIIDTNKKMYRFMKYFSFRFPLKCILNFNLITYCFTVLVYLAKFRRKKIYHTMILIFQGFFATHIFSDDLI